MSYSSISILEGVYNNIEGTTMNGMVSIWKPSRYSKIEIYEQDGLMVQHGDPFKTGSFGRKGEILSKKQRKVLAISVAHPWAVFESGEVATYRNPIVACQGGGSYIYQPRRRPFVKHDK